MRKSRSKSQEELVKNQIPLGQLVSTLKASESPGGWLNHRLLDPTLNCQFSKPSVGLAMLTLLVPGPPFETHCSKPKHWAQGFIFQTPHAALFLNYWNKIKQWNYRGRGQVSYKLEIALPDLRKYKWILTGESGFGSYSLLQLVFSVPQI